MNIEEFKKIIDFEGFTVPEISEHTLDNVSTIRSGIHRNNSKVPRWVKWFIIGYKIGSGQLKSARGMK